jgi:hypothetical protein
MQSSRGMKIRSHNSSNYNDSLNVKKISLWVYDSLRSFINKRWNNIELHLNFRLSPSLFDLLIVNSTFREVM